MMHAKGFVIRALSLLALIMLPGCLQKNEKNKAALSKKQAAFLLPEIETNINIAALSAGNVDPEIEAKLHDVPSLLGSVLVDSPDSQNISNDQRMLAWISNFDYQTIIQFYSKEMEHLGWQRLAMITAAETVLLYQKPKKVCVISIRPLAGKFKNSYTHLIHVCQSSKDK